MIEPKISRSPALSPPFSMSSRRGRRFSRCSRWPPRAGARRAPGSSAAIWSATSPGARSRSRRSSAPTARADSVRSARLRLRPLSRLSRRPGGHDPEGRAAAHHRRAPAAGDRHGLRPHQSEGLSGRAGDVLGDRRALHRRASRWPTRRRCSSRPLLGFLAADATLIFAAGLPAVRSFFLTHGVAVTRRRRRHVHPFGARLDLRRGERGDAAGGVTLPLYASLAKRPEEGPHRGSAIGAGTRRHRVRAGAHLCGKEAIARRTRSKKRSQSLASMFRAPQAKSRATLGPSRDRSCPALAADEKACGTRSAAATRPYDGKLLRRRPHHRRLLPAELRLAAAKARERLVLRRPPRRPSRRAFAPASAAGPTGSARPTRRSRRSSAPASGSRRPRRRPSLAELAASAGLSPFHFHRVFKKVAGVTPKAFAAQMRARRAAENLAHRRDGHRGDLRRGVQLLEPLLRDRGGAARHDPDRGPARRRGRRRSASRSARASLGAVLVAATEKGVAAIMLGDDPDELARDLAGPLPARGIDRRRRDVRTDGRGGRRPRRGARPTPRSAARHPRHRVPATGLAGAPRHPARPDGDLRRDRASGRPAEGGARGRSGLRRQSARRRDPLPSGGADRRRPLRLSLGRRAQAQAARSRGGMTRRGR